VRTRSDADSECSKRPVSASSVECEPGGWNVAATRKSEARLSESDASQVIALLKDVDSVELKLTVPEDAHRSTVAALDMDPLNAQIRRVFFFDTPDLSLNRHGLVVRAQRIQRKGEDSVVKLRPVEP
jgi:hypothetical protein